MQERVLCLPKQLVASGLYQDGIPADHQCSVDGMADARSNGKVDSVVDGYAAGGDNESDAGTNAQGPPSTIFSSAAGSAPSLRSTSSLPYVHRKFSSLQTSFMTYHTHMFSSL